MKGNPPKLIFYSLMILFLSLVSVPSCAQETTAPATKAVSSKTLNLKPGGISFVGETIQYSIKNLAVKAGEATLRFDGVVTLEGKQYIGMTFRAQGFNFFDEEKIYADPQTLYPIVIQRTLNIFGKKEKITEEYHQSEGVVKVLKTVGDKVTEQVLKKEGTIDNIYCFIYRYRQQGSFQTGDSLKIKLPTKDITIDLVKTTQLKAAGHNYQAYYLQSEPAQYKLWLDQSAQKIPLRIDGALGFGKMSMTMRNYQNSAANPSRKSISSKENPLDAAR